MSAYGVRVAIGLVVVVGCQQELPTPPAPVPPAPPPPVSHAPFLIKNRVVGEDGRVIRTLPDVDAYEDARPDGPHRFVFERAHGEWAKTREHDKPPYTLVVDTEANTVTPRHDDVAVTHQTLFGRPDADTYTLERYTPDGASRWSQPITGWRTVRPPDLVRGGGRVVVTIGEEIRAYDDATGKLAWTKPRWGSRLHIAGDTLYSIDCNEPTDDHALQGFRLSDGMKIVQANLELGCDPYVTVAPTGQLIFVVEESKHVTHVFDLAGREVVKLDEVVLGRGDDPWGGAFVLDDDLLVLTDKHVIRMRQDGRVLWKIDPLANTFVSEDMVALLPGGDVLIANYCAIADSGVELVRLHPNGKVVWHAQVRGLGVPHSQYAHLAYIEVRGDQLFVISQGSSGSLMEKLSVMDGRQLSRWTY